MCGIWGYSGTDFNKYKFNTLGLYNDARGGDSCGIFYKNKDGLQLEYGHDKTKLFKVFVEDNNFIKSDENTLFAFGHCRKASVGAIGLNQAQPVSLYNKKGEIVFTMIHNGTLLNYKQLAEKYNIEYSESETDSQIFCKIVRMKGYDLLKEYDGAGAFIFWDKRDGLDSIKVFKGASRMYSNKNDIYEERPLYAILTDGSSWFSSMESSLKFINDDDNLIIDIEANILYTIKNGKIISEIPIDRSERKQVETLTYKYEKSQFPVQGSDNRWDSYDYDDWYSGYPSRYIQKELPYNGSKESEYPKCFLSYTNTDVIVCRYVKDKIIFTKDGLYEINGDLCHGKYECSPAGFTNSKFDLNTYWFFNGVMMDSYFSYLCACEFCLLMFEDNPDDLFPSYLAKFSTTPVPLYFESEDEDLKVAFLKWDKTAQKEVEVTGTFYPYFTYSKNVYDVKDGFIEGMTDYSGQVKYLKNNPLLELDRKILSGELSVELTNQMINYELEELLTTVGLPY